ncbi:hypothetical protein HMPREF0765_0660 [Sphingobacterium spiritivorum ATCC 33300]|uniref:Uncharacterized protein n=1 Tax=Sphingobacterium spiritivorum ATCC 33300 TaxID=525372 RepID=C2FTK4_SPHSI|nr:hypothetical protein HMPREF0765_0660 [Sphingobacterium spiritivorum ATCC 33300]
MNLQELALSRSENSKVQRYRILKDYDWPDGKEVVKFDFKMMLLISWINLCILFL